jgi:hypothetical protein
MVRTRAMTIRPADSSSDTDMDSSPRTTALPAPKQPEIIESVVAIRPIQHAVPTILPISQPSQTLQDLLTSLPSPVKIEELDFNF